MAKKIKVAAVSTPAPPSSPVEEVQQLPEQISEPTPEVVQSEPLVQTPEPKPPKTPKIRAKKTKIVQTVVEEVIEPLNLMAQFDQEAQNPTTEEEQVQDQAEDVQMEEEQSEDSEIDFITNPDQKKLAQEAKASLKRDIIQQAHDLVYQHLTDFPDDFKKKASNLVVRAYDDPISLFKALKAGSKGMLKFKFNNLPKPTLLADSKIGAKKLEGFRQFLNQRINKK